MNKLAFEIRPSPETNDHEVCVLVDGRSVLDEKHIGVDPSEFFVQFSRPNINHLLIGRCSCGTVGCSDYFVSVQRSTGEVTWCGREDLRFDRAQYEEAVRRASNDFSWEDQKRRAERLVGDVLNGCHTEDGFTFQWASARVAPMLMKLSFAKGGEQKMLEFSWDGTSDESATQSAERLRRQLVDEQ